MSSYSIPLHAVSPIKGRGSASRMAHRFAKDERNGFDDGWGSLEDAGFTLCEAPPTQVTAQQARNAISRNDSPDIQFDYGLNPCRGCEHGCIYCHARPTHSYLNLSPGLDFETRLVAKPNLPQVLARELQAASYLPRQIVIGS
jgi:hypothetical protein